RIRTATDKHTHAILPGCASAEDTAKMDTCFGGQLESLIERAIAHSCGEKQERFGGYRSGLSKKLKGLCASVYECSGRGRGSFDIGHGYGHADFQDIDAILRLGESLHRTPENRRFATRELRTFFIDPVLVRNNFQEERDVTAGAFRSDALDPNPLALLYFWCIGQGIVQQNFNGVCAGVNQSAHGPVLQKPRKARRNFRVVPTYFV